MEMNLNVAISDEPVFEQSTTIYVFFLTYIAFSNTLARSVDDSLARSVDDSLDRSDDDHIHYTTHSFYIPYYLLKSLHREKIERLINNTHLFIILSFYTNHLSVT